MGKGAVAARNFFLLNDFSPLSRSLEQATILQAWVSGHWSVPFSSYEALQIDGLFHQGQFPLVVDMRQGESNIFQISTWTAFFIIKRYIYYENPTDFGKTVETLCGSACLPNCPLKESPTTGQCQVECWHVIVEVELFYSELLTLFR